MRVTWPAGAYVYDVNPDEYGTYNLTEIEQIDIENFEDSPMLFLEPMMEQLVLRFFFNAEIASEELG